jgi:hypothetical protein
MVRQAMVMQALRSPTPPQQREPEKHSVVLQSSFVPTNADWPRNKALYTDVDE